MPAVSMEAQPFQQYSAGRRASGVFTQNSSAQSDGSNALVTTVNFKGAAL